MEAEAGCEVEEEEVEEEVEEAEAAVDAAAEKAEEESSVPDTARAVPMRRSASWRRRRLARRSSPPSMGFFDSLKAAFENEDMSEQDQRVRASHILCKGDDDIERITILMQEIGKRVEVEGNLGAVFAEVARRESECSSASMGGDLGLFGPKKMVQEFDDVLFPEDPAMAPPPGAVLGPIVTEFGCHVILVTKREQSNDQVEEKLARND